MDTSDALDNSLEESWDEWLNFVDLANFEDFLKLGEEKSLLDAVSEWPILEQTLQERDSQSPVFGEEEHGTSEELLVELRTCLNLVKRNNDILEENDVFIPERNGETTNNTCQDIKKLGSTVEFVGFMDEGEEALIDSLSDHLSSWNQFGVEFVENVFQVVSFDGLLRVEELQEFLHELGCYINLERSDFDGFINYKLQEKLVNSLEMWPSWVNLIFGLNTSFGEGQILFFDVWERSEDVFLDHSHDIIQMRDDQADDCFLILE